MRNSRSSMIVALTLAVSAPLPADVVYAAEGGHTDPYGPPAIAPASEWYYCASAGTYYPYATECPEGWELVVPQAPAS